MHARLQTLPLRVVAWVWGGEARTHRGGTKVAASTTVAMSPTVVRCPVPLDAESRGSRARRWRSRRVREKWRHLFDTIYAANTTISISFSYSQKRRMYGRSIVLRARTVQAGTRIIRLFASLLILLPSCMRSRAMLRSGLACFSSLTKFELRYTYYQ